MRSAIQSLELPMGSHGLDVGCGIGSNTKLLAEAVGSRGHVTGSDINPAFLAHAKKTMSQSDLSERISFREGDIHALPFENDFFDWIWSSDCAGYPTGELLPVLEQLIRVTKPGGQVAILGWSSQQLLPGHPLFEARLNATCSVLEPYITGIGSEQHFVSALKWFRKAGLKEIGTQSFAGDVHGPLNKNLQKAVLAFFGMLWIDPQSKLTPADWEKYQRLCTPGSPDFILNLPEYYGFFTYTMFHGKVKVVVTLPNR